MVNINTLGSSSGSQKLEFDGDMYAEKYNFEKFKRETNQNLEDIGIKIDILKSNISIATKNKNNSETPFKSDVEFKN